MAIPHNSDVPTLLWGVSRKLGGIAFIISREVYLYYGGIIRMKKNILCKFKNEPTKRKNEDCKINIHFDVTKAYIFDIGI